MKYDITVTKSIIDTLFDHHLEYTYDDESELFPFLKQVIKGTINTITEPKLKKEATAEIKDYVKQKYIDFWLKTVEEDYEGEIDLKEETLKAVERFHELEIELN